MRILGKLSDLHYQLSGALAVEFAEVDTLPLTHYQVAILDKYLERRTHE
jgi:hypothetical protein